MRQPGRNEGGTRVNEAQVLETREMTAADWTKPGRRNWREANRALQRWHQPKTTLAPVRWMSQIADDDDA
jgi:hypothetical protein